MGYIPTEAKIGVHRGDIVVHARVLPCVMYILLISCTSIQSKAQEKETSDAAIQKKLDPTDFRSRLEFRNDYQRTSVDGSRNLILPRLDWAYSKSLAFRVEVPFVSETPTNGPGHSGLGDVLGRVAYRAARGDGYAWVVGSELTLDTAQSGLGAGTQVLSGFTFVSLDMPQWKSVLFPYYQYTFNVGGQNHISLSTIRLSALTRWPERFYTFLEPTVLVDHQHNGRVGGTLELEVGRFVSSDVAIWARPGVGIREHALPFVYKWDLEVGFRYFLN